MTPTGIDYVWRNCTRIVPVHRRQALRRAAGFGRTPWPFDLQDALKAIPEPQRPRTTRMVFTSPSGLFSRNVHRQTEMATPEKRLYISLIFFEISISRRRSRSNLPPPTRELFDARDTGPSVRIDWMWITSPGQKAAGRNSKTNTERTCIGRVWVD